MRRKLKRAQPVQVEEADRGAGVRTDQTGAGLPPVPVAWRRESACRVGADLHPPQPHQARQARLTRLPWPYMLVRTAIWTDSQASGGLIRDISFEAGSGFTRVTALWLAQPPEAAFVARLRAAWFPERTACQLPDQSTTLWVEPTSTGANAPSGRTEQNGPAITPGRAVCSRWRMATSRCLRQEVLRESGILDRIEINLDGCMAPTWKAPDPPIWSGSPPCAVIGPVSRSCATRSPSPESWSDLKNGDRSA